MGEVRVESTVRIARSVEEVMAVLHDIAAQHEWWPGQYRSEPLETDDERRVTRAAIGNDVKVAKDNFEVVYTHDEHNHDEHSYDQHAREQETGYRWVLAAPSSIQRAQEGAWEVRADGVQGAQVTLRLMVDSTLPLPGFLLRKALQDTAGGATRGLRERCEA